MSAFPDGQMGNAEVGHTNLGAGRLVMQDCPLFDVAIVSGEIARMPPPRALVLGSTKARR